MNRYFEAYRLMNVHPYTQISELWSAESRIDTHALSCRLPFHRFMGLLYNV